MKTQLTPEQIEQYRENGFLPVRGFLSAEEVAELKAAVEATMATMGRQKVAGGGADLVEEDDYYSRVFKQRLNLWRLNDTVKRYMLHANLGKMLCDLEGVDGMRVWHDQTLIKQAFGNPTAWHLDNPYWSFYSRNAISIWIALEPATFQNGCMWFIPGSHRLARFESVGIGEDMAALFNFYPEMKAIDSVGVPMEPGDCSFHNGLTAHGAGVNMTRGTRMAMTCAYMPDGSTFNGQQNILPKAYFETLKKGDLLDNDDWNPRL